MNPLVDHTLIYDEDCPLCQAYSSAFIKAGMLDSNGRATYSTVVAKGGSPIDLDRARNEIALINRKDQTVTYGNTSLLRIIGYRWPIVSWIFNFKPLRFLLDQLYFFISFNRKVIAPGNVFEKKNHCTPDLNYTYRCAYIVFAWIITSLVLVAYFSLIKPVIPAVSFTAGFLVCGGQLVFQGIIVALVNKKRLIHYLGNMMTVTLLGAILLAPALMLDALIDYKFFLVSYFLAVVGVMLIEHIRRVKILELPRYISMTWILYQLIGLVVIL